MSYNQVDSPTPGRLFVGGAPKPQDDLEVWADTLVLCAAEYQPTNDDLEMGPTVEILRLPMDDTTNPNDMRQVWHFSQISTLVAKRLHEGKTVVVTCMCGLNRSCLVAGMAMRMCGVESDEVVSRLRQARGPNGLNNEQFLTIIRSTVPVFIQ